MATVNEKMTAIANAIRNKSGSTKALTLDDMASGVDEVYQNGFDYGNTLGYTKGKSDGLYDGKQQGIAEGIEQGKKAEHSDFWDAFQSNGERVNYYRAFANHNSASSALGWNETTFRPKYDLRPTGIAQGFMYLSVSDLEEHLNKCGIVLDLQNCTSLQQTFQLATITVFPILHLKKATELGNVFGSCTKLHTVRKIIFESGTTASFSSMFSGCSALKNIDEVEGSIEHNISFSACPLTKETIKRIITHLKDYTDTDSEYKYTITLKTSAFNTLEAEGSTAEYNSVPCTWAELIDNKKWNLVKA